jgi:hypothetical protein
MLRAPEVPDKFKHIRHGCMAGSFAMLLCLVLLATCASRPESESAKILSETQALPSSMEARHRVLQEVYVAAAEAEAAAEARAENAASEVKT